MVMEGLHTVPQRLAIAHVDPPCLPTMGIYGTSVPSFQISLLSIFQSAPKSLETLQGGSFRDLSAALQS